MELGQLETRIERRVQRIAELEIQLKNTQAALLQETAQFDHVRQEQSAIQLHLETERTGLENVGKRLETTKNQLVEAESLLRRNLDENLAKERQLEQAIDNKIKEKMKLLQEVLAKIAAARSGV